MPDFRARPKSLTEAGQQGRPARRADAQQAAERVLDASNTKYLKAEIAKVDEKLTQVRDAPFITLELSDIMSAERLLTAGTDISFVDGGPKEPITFILAATGIAAGTYGAALKIPIIQFDIKGRAIAVSETPLGTAALLNSSADGTLAANSDLLLATQKAVKTYVDAAVTGLWDLKGATNCASNPNYPAASKGDAYFVSGAGKIGGASGITVEVGDLFVALADNAGGTQVAVGASWSVIQANLVGALLAGNNLSDVADPATARSNIGAGTVASVAASGGTTGLSFSGGPITGGGTLTLAGTLAPANGGTGTATAFTTGSVVFAGAAGVYSQNNSKLFWDNTNGRFGIGTGSPGAELEVADSAGDNDVRINLRANGSTISQLGCSTTQTFVDSPGARPFVIYVNGGERFRVSDTAGLQMGGANTVIDANRLLNARSYTVATLPTPGTGGRVAFASNCRVFNGAGAQEGAGAGTGGLVSDNGSAWKIAGTNVTAVA